jgi:branched-chain amino acid transport system substrate-binding protein
MRRIVGLIIIVLAVVGIVLYFSGSSDTEEVKKEIKVGAIINLTGPASSWGQYHAKGHKDYFRYVNEVKGGVAGKMINLTVVDSAYKVSEALKYVKKFCTQDKMDMMATWSAGAGIMAKPVIQECGIPNINYSTYQGILKDDVSYVYLPFGSYIMDSYAVLEYIKNIHKGDSAPKVGLLTYNNAYGKSIHAPAKEYAGENNIDIVDIEEFPPKALDLNTELLRLKQKGAEYIFVQNLPSAIIMALQAADRASYDVKFFGTWTSTDPDFFKRGKGLIRDRVFMQFPGCLPGDDAPAMKTLEAMWEKYGTVTKFDASYWEGVAIAMIMERAFQRAHEKFGEINAKTIDQALETFRDEDMGGIVPNITYTETDHGASFKARIVQVHEDATYTPVTNFWVPGKEEIKLLK